MAERKVLTKYYPPEFDPAALTRVKKPKQQGPRIATVRLMAPCSMRCTTCGEYIYKGRKFNARKETPADLKYLGIQIFRFYIRCTRCSVEIVFRTDPKNQDYMVERGAKRNTEPWRRGRDDEIEESDEARLDRIEREMAEADGEGAAGDRNAMEELEAKTAEARREMAVADALDEIRSRNARIARAERDGTEVVAASTAAPGEEVERLRQAREDEEAAKRAFAFTRKVEEEWEEMDVKDEEGGGDGEDELGGKGEVDAGDLASLPPRPAPTPAPSFQRQIKKKKDHAALLGIKKKAT